MCDVCMCVFPPLRPHLCDSPNVWNMPAPVTHVTRSAYNGAVCQGERDRKNNGAKAPKNRQRQDVEPFSLGQDKWGEGAIENTRKPVNFWPRVCPLRQNTTVETFTKGPLHTLVHHPLSLFLSPFRPSKNIGAGRLCAR